MEKMKKVETIPLTPKTGFYNIAGKNRHVRFEPVHPTWMQMLVDELVGVRRAPEYRVFVDGVEKTRHVVK